MMGQKKGMTILESYAKKADLAKDEQEFIYIMLLFPEKYWKLLNGYFNHKRAGFRSRVSKNYVVWARWNSAATSF